MTKRILAYLAGLILCIAVVGVMFFVTSQPRGEAIVLLPAPTQAPLVVDVGGAVKLPGVYTLPAGSRVQDAITMAGGLAPEADPSTINLAAKLRDGQKVLVPVVAVEGTQPASEPAASYPIDLNTATQAELDSLPGIGATRAEDILAYREAHGGFKSIDELKQVGGIGDTTFERIKDLIFVEQP
jgi:competence protein ComEA